MKNLLKGKIFGMPRWAFFTLLAVGIGAGLYLRSRSTGGGGDEELTDEELAEEEVGGDYLGEGLDEPGLAGGVGVVSPPGGVYPVSTPYIPEGLTEIIGQLSGGLVEAASYRSDAPADAVVQPQAPAAVPSTGGGPPKRPNVHKAPSKAVARKRVQAIAKRHGARSPQAARARKRLGIKAPPKKKAKRR